MDAKDKNSEPIGFATKEEDGTIVLNLYTSSDGSGVEAQFRYPPSDPDYALISDHLGPFKPGQQVNVKPFKND